MIVHAAYTHIDVEKLISTAILILGFDPFNFILVSERFEPIRRVFGFIGIVLCYIRTHHELYKETK